MKPSSGDLPVSPCVRGLRGPLSNNRPAQVITVESSILSRSQDSWANIMRSLTPPPPIDTKRHGDDRILGGSELIDGSGQTF